MKYCIGLTLVLLFCSCRQPAGTKVHLVLQSGTGEKITLTHMLYNEEKETVVDSAIGRRHLDSFDLMIDGPRNGVYRLRIGINGLQVPFINDSDYIRISCDYSSRRCRFINSPVNAEMQAFIKEQDSLSLHVGASEAQQHAVGFADTVSNPGVFMFAYNSIDYGKDLIGLKKFITKAAARFPSNAAVKALQRNTLDYIKIFEEEYAIGDSLPAVKLPDQYGQERSTYAGNDVYTFIDFWSTWSPGAHEFSEVKKQLRKRVGKDKLAMVSVAIDAEKDSWKKIVDYEHYDWLQLIDEKMWQGPAVKTLKFDSIPFNFLLDPHKRIIAKAISPDSLLGIVTRSIKRAEQ
ncbi:MAG TPA: thioredoxin-like domain-containing protein [Puia sp.]|nr:thioredoxin-like domain-containing protein [Puia sp.]